MTGRIATAFARWLEAGGEVIGQVKINRLPDDHYRLTHCDEPAGEGEGLEAFNRPEAARQVAMYDEAGEYRPLKTAANLRRGWVLTLSGQEALLQAIDFFYPAALGVWSAGEMLEITPLRATLDRQSGMYAVTRKISDDAAQEVVGQLCRSRTGCLKRILWEIRPGVPVKHKEPIPDREGSLPLLCNEGCNLLVAALREEVKKG